MRKGKSNERSSKSGMAPGSFIFTGHRRMESTVITLIQYNKESYTEENYSDIHEVLKKVDSSQNVTSWLNISGIHDVELVEKICVHYDIHRLTGEDILSVGQRPKLEEFDDYIHLVLKMFMMNDSKVSYEQITFLLKKNLLITFQESVGDVFDPVRKRLDEGKGQIRSRSSDYLAYALADAVVDNYFVILEQIGEQLEDMELEMMESPTDNVLQRLYQIRREAMNLRRSVYPLREVVNQMGKTESKLIHAETKLFVRDLYDHTIQAIETIEIFREIASGMLDLYMNSISNKMNNVMKVLTIIATIFIPLTFIVGVYGMNFEFMPELSYKWSYPIVMFFMCFIAIGMLIFFRRKKWL